MEQSILKAKTLQTDLEVVVEPGKDSSMTGRLVVGSENTMRLELAGSVRGKAGKIRMVSDGKKVQFAEEGKPVRGQDAPGKLGQIVRTSVARAGIFVPCS